MMKHLTLLTITSLIWTVMAFPPSNDQKKIVCYLGSWSIYRPGNGKFSIEDIDPSLCTHLIYAFAGLTGSNIRVHDAWQDLPDNWGKDGYGRFNALRAKNPSLKTMIAIGGWNEGSVPFSRMAKTPESREQFANNAVQFVKKQKFDGLDMDWEYPAQRDGNKDDIQNFVLLLKAMKYRFEKEGLLLTAAVGATENSASKSYIIPEMVKYLDFINLMTYDFYGGWERQTGIHAALYNNGHSVKGAIDYWLSQGTPKEKLIVGVPTYGRSFTLANPNVNGVGVQARDKGAAGPYTREDGILGYNEICEKFTREQGWQIVHDSERHVPYAFKGDQWIGYDDTKSAQEKAELIQSMGLGGAMIWSVDTDDFKGTCGPKYPILNVLNDVLRNGAPRSIFVPPSPPTFVEVPEEPDFGQPDSYDISNPDVPEVGGNDIPPTNPDVANECYSKDLVAIPGSCDYVHCQPDGLGGFITHIRPCPAGLCFNPEIQTCDWKQ